MTSVQDDVAHGFHLLKDGDAWCAVGRSTWTSSGRPQASATRRRRPSKALRAELRKAG